MIVFRSARHVQSYTLRKANQTVKLKSKKELSLTIIYYALDALILKIVVTIEEILTIAIVLR